MAMAATWPSAAAVIASDNILSLETMTNSFSAPITEEHAFAIIYECMKSLAKVLSAAESVATFSGKVSSRKVSSNSGKVLHRPLAVVSGTADIMLRKDGTVHGSTFVEAPDSGEEEEGRKLASASPGRQMTNSVEKVISELGLVIYSALDFGLKENEERTLTPGLENLLDLMTSLVDDSSSEEGEDDDAAVSDFLRRGDTDDEGIERDHQDDDQLLFGGRGGGNSGDRGQHSSLESSSSSSGHHRDHHRGPRQRRHLRRGDRGEGGSGNHSGGDSESVVADGSIDRVLSLCSNHLAVRSEADSHFRAVCRALVSESIELSMFLEKTRRAKEDREHNEELSELALQDWAHLWIQTMSELRQGVKLKKNDNYSKTPIEYELTPYEMLMDDIRSRRYKLNPVLVDGKIPPKVKRDAHDIILDFIRSRPPLRPASRRKLAPAQKYYTPAELLMESIRASSTKETLRKTERMTEVAASSLSRAILEPEFPEECERNKKAVASKSVFVAKTDLQKSSSFTPSTALSATPKNVTRIVVNSTSAQTTASTSSWTPPPLNTTASAPSVLNRQKVVVRPDPSFMLFDSSESDNEDHSNFPGGGSDSRKTSKAEFPGRGGDSRKTSHVTPKSRPVARRPPKRVQFGPDEPDEDEQPRQQSDLSGVNRRHTLSHIDLSNVEEFDDDEDDDGDDSEASRRRRRRRLVDSEHWANALQTLDLTLAEVIHIRSVLTKAEIEGLTIDTNLREDLERGKVCFLCMKTRFGIFTWSYQCKLCQHTVCSSCLTKMRIPSEHFTDVPVFALSPSSTPSGSRKTSEDSNAGDFPESRRAANSNGSSFFPMFRQRRSASAQRRRLSSSSSDTSASDLQLNPAASLASIPAEVDRSRGFLNRFSPFSQSQSQTQSHSQSPEPQNLGGGRAGNSNSRVKLRRSNTMSASSTSLHHQHRPSVAAPSPQFEEGKKSQMNVCVDCKDMILQIIKVQRANRRRQLTRSLCLS